MYGYVYKTTCLLNNKIYVGQHTGGFKKNYMGSGIHIMRSVKKYGKDNFAVVILGYAHNKKSLNILERYHISVCRNSMPKELIYNISDGGEGTSGIHLSGELNGMYGKKHSKKTILKMKMNLPNRQGKNSCWYGRHHKPESLNKIGLASIGRQTFLGRKHTPESIKKMSEAKKGKTAWNKGLTRDDPRVAKYADQLKGQPKSIEHRKNLSIARRRLYGTYINKV